MQLPTSQFDNKQKNLVPDMASQTKKKMSISSLSD